MLLLEEVTSNTLVGSAKTASREDFPSKLCCRTSARFKDEMSVLQDVALEQYKMHDRVELPEVTIGWTSRGMQPILMD